MQNRNSKQSLIIFLICVPVIIFGFVAANYFNAKKTCKDVAINILNNKEVNFLKESDIVDIVNNQTPIINGTTKISAINIKNLEASIQANPWVNNANIYFNNANKLIIEVEQRTPVLRWMHSNISQNYLDENAIVIPVTSDFSANVPIVTSQALPTNIKVVNLKLQLVALAKIIKADTFWNAAITQINVTDKYNFELFTTLSDTKIIFGDTLNMKNKLDKLFLFYKDIAPRAGWETYSQLDVTYDGQIVAKKYESAIVASATKILPNPVIKKSTFNISLGTSLSKKSVVNKNKVVKVSQKENIKTKPKPDAVLAKGAPKAGVVKNKINTINKNQLIKKTTTK